MSDHYNPSSNYPITLMDILHNVKMNNKTDIDDDKNNNDVQCDCFNCINVNRVESSMTDSIFTCTTPELINYNPPIAPSNSNMFTSYQNSCGAKMDENYQNSCGTKMVMNSQLPVGFSQMGTNYNIPRFLYTDIPDIGKKWCIAGMNCSENNPKHATIYYHIAICKLGSKCQNYSYWHVPMHSGV